MTTAGTSFHSRNETTNCEKNEQIISNLLQTLQQSIAFGRGEEAAQTALKLADQQVLCAINAIDLGIRFEDIHVDNGECLTVPVNLLTTIEQLQTEVYHKYKVPIYNQRLTFVKTENHENQDVRSQNVEPDVQMDVIEETVEVDSTTTFNHLIEEVDLTDSPASIGKWSCSSCTYLNDETEKLCGVCGLLGTGQNEENKANFDTYLELLNYENTELVTNLDAFECPICLTIQYAGDGVVLKTCLHTFCKNCLGEFIKHSTDAEIKCPYLDNNYACGALLQEREIKQLVNSEDYEKHLARSINEAESKTPNSFHCRTANCVGWCIFEDGNNYFQCPVCFEVNCLTCQVIHTGLSCRQYQDELNLKAANDETANQTKLQLEAMLESGKAMRCATCSIVIMKNNGCDGITCSMCKTDLCWATKRPRWGPNGRGDTSGGCRCRVNGKLCHPKCKNCH